MRYFRWALYIGAALLVVCVITALLLKACGVNFTSGPHKIVASDDVIYLVPWEQGHYTEGAGFDYFGASVTASEKGGFLKVDGKSYGALKIGDSVDLTKKGIVLINDQVRQPW